jgi:hypothetical protein
LTHHLRTPLTLEVVKDGITDASLLHHSLMFLGLSFSFSADTTISSINFLFFALLYTFSRMKRSSGIVVVLSFWIRQDLGRTTGRNLAKLWMFVVFFVVDRSVFTHDYHYFNERRKVRSLKLHRPSNHHAFKHPPTPYYYSPPSPSPSRCQPD